ncbi:MAG: hypothetical protein ACYCUG_17200 [Acidimicrobiales bacterium]
MTGRRPAPLVSPAAVAAVAAHPSLWPTALRVGLSTAAPGWWRAWPPRPRLPADYAELRRQAMWGAAAGARLDGGELVAYLRWCRDMRVRRR